VFTGDRHGGARVLQAEGLDVTVEMIFAVGKQVEKLGLRVTDRFVV
jgi:hypothetical protein